MLEFLRDQSAESDGSEKLIRLVKWIRPQRSDRPDHAESKLNVLISFLREESQIRESLRNDIVKCISKRDQVQMYTETGIMQATGFFTEINNRFKHKILPPLISDNDLRKLLQRVFYKRTDYLWLQNTNPDLLKELFDVLRLFQLVEDKTSIKEQLINAVVIISHRITSMGLEREIRDRLIHVDELNSPFITQSYEVMSYLEKVRQSDFVDRESEDLKQILVLLGQCEDCLKELKSNKQKFGVSLSMTFLMGRLQQNISRMRMLLEMLHSPEEKKHTLLVQFIIELVKADNLKNSIFHHLNDNIGLMAYQVVEHAGRTGEHYITSDRKEYFKFWFASMKGGFIVGFLAVVKLLLYYLHLAPFWEAFAYSLNYAFGFITIHVTHSALATKQPAMTASRIASSLDKRSGVAVSLTDVVIMIAKVTRSQLISLIGNLMICFPMGILLAWSWKQIFGVHLADPEKAMHILHDVHPWETLSLVYAALTGVYLFISGLISGYFDNLLIYRSIGQRLREHRGLKKIMKPARLDKFCSYIEQNIGSIAGNLFLGIFLGFTSTVGFIFGIPLDIRHITFSSAGLGIGLVGVDFNVSYTDGLIAMVGIFGIGLMNFCFSFGLAFYTAMRSRGMALKSIGALSATLFKYFIKHPLEFIFPPAKQEVEILEEQEA
jgi:site-specific recombinase